MSTPRSRIKQLATNINGLRRLTTTTTTTTTTPTTPSFNQQQQQQQQNVPESGEIVIVGAGAIGSSVAYHLAKCGWKDIVLLEQGAPGCGTTWHAAGLCGTVRGSRALSDIAMYGVDLYSDVLEAETGVSTGFKRCGSLNIATCRDRSIYLRRLHILSKQFGNECHLVGPEEACRLNPLLNKEDLELAMWVPNDGMLDPSNLVQAYMKGAKMQGALTLVEGVKVVEVESDGREVQGINTDHGYISCGTLINCTGMWGWEMGQLSRPQVSVPLHPCNHFYVTTGPVEGVDPMMPVTRDYDARTYLREWSGGLLGGGFEANAKGVFYETIPDKFHFQLLGEDWPQFEQLMDGLLHRYPCFHEAQIRTFTNGPESFTPDGLPYVCRTPELRNYFMAAGMSSLGIVSSAGLGKCLAELITHGESSISLRAHDSRRMPPGSNNKLWCLRKAEETVSSSYNVSYPVIEVEDTSLSASPVHELLRQRGAVWGKKPGSSRSRPMYFRQDGDVDHTNTLDRPGWLSNVQSELRAMEETVGLVDMSIETKIEITCTQSETLTQLLDECCLYKGFGVVMKPGDIVETVVVDEAKQTLVACVDVLKLDQHRFMFLADAEQHVYLSSYLNEKISDNKFDIAVRDVTGEFALFGMVGPESENILRSLLSPPFTLDNMRYGEGGCVDIGYSSNVMLCRHFIKLQHGWQMLVPANQSHSLYTMLNKMGQNHGLKTIGSLALSSLRVRHMIPTFGSEIGAHTTVESFYEGATSSAMSLVQIEIQLPSEQNWPWGGEPVLLAGEIVTNLSSVGYCGESDKVLGLAVVRNGDLVVGDAVDIKVGSDSYRGRVTIIC